MKIETLEVAGLESAIKGMRLPMMSREKSDSIMCNGDCIYAKRKCQSTPLCPKYVNRFIIGENDMNLCKRLVKAGYEHSKFTRMIQVWADVNMPRYIWSELDTYKFNTKNSESTMHRLLNNPNPITFALFEYDVKDRAILETVVERLEELRQEYLITKDFALVVRAKKLLPEGFLQMRTWNTNYAELRNIYFQRRNHRLKQEWDIVMEWIESLPYAKELIMHEG